MLPAFFHQTPFFRYLLPFLLGILTGFQITIPVMIALPICICLWIGLCLLLWRWKILLLHKLHWLYGCLLYLFLFAAGCCVTSVHRFVAPTSSEAGVYLAVITEPLTEKENSMKTTVRIQARRLDSSWLACDEQVMVYFRKDDFSHHIRQGDLLMMETTLNPVTNAGNPYEFDYQKYLYRKRIGRSAFVESGKWQYLESDAQGPLTNFSNRLRTTLLDVFKRSGLTGNELAVASALVLGYKADLDDVLRGAYSASGAMHVLAVSGLHVGILYVIFNMVLGLIPFLQRSKWLKALILLAVLWLYALITGMSPSVMRAATMFSFIVVGAALRRKAYIYNSIAASAFLLLLIHPTLLYDVGFQLSYMAVLAIVFLYPKLYALLSFKRWLPDQAWSLTCVSVAAQTGTIPLTLYYFHQFPTYFALTNFLVIPGAIAIIYGSVFLFVVAPIPFLLQWTGWILDKVIYCFNSGVFFVEKLPCSVIWGIRFQQWESILLYAVVIVICAWILSVRKVYLLILLVLCLFWVTGTVVRDYHDLSRRQMIVYHVPGSSLLQFIEGRENTIWYESRKPAFNVSHTIEYQRIAMQFNEPHYMILDTALSYTGAGKDMLDLYVKDSFVGFSGKRLAIYTRKFPPRNTGEQLLKTDIVVLLQNVTADIRQIVEIHHPDIVVIDDSNSLVRMNRWEQECTQLGVKCHRIDRDGAFVLTAN